MIGFLVLLVFVLGLVAGYTWLTRRPSRHRISVAEYWVFLPSEKMPEQDAVMTRMVAQNPYAVRGRSPIGPAEGLVFSDVRLHIGFVLRKRNAHAFRPDLFEATTEIDAEILQSLAEANAFVKLRYLSETPLADKRHLQFLVHAADAYAELGNGTVVYDQTAERLLTRHDLAAMLRANLDATRAALQTRIVWIVEATGARAETRGMRKVGLPDLVTLPVSPDQRVLVTNILETALDKVWTEPILPAEVEVEAFDDKFRVVLTPGRDDRAQARLLRVEGA